MDESDPDQGNNSSGDETDRDPRRGGQEFYDAISDPAALRNAMDPISEQVNSADLTQTPIPPLFTDRATSVATGPVPYNAQGQQPSQATSMPLRQVQQNVAATPVDKVLAIRTTFFATVPAIGLDEMSNNNYLDKVYTVDESDPDQGNNSSGDESVAIARSPSGNVR